MSKKITLLLIGILFSLSNLQAREYLNKGIHFEILAGFNQPKGDKDNPYGEFKGGYTFNNHTNISACFMYNHNTAYDKVDIAPITLQIRQYIGSDTYNLPLFIDLSVGCSEVHKKAIIALGGGFVHNITDKCGLQIFASINNNSNVKLGVGIVF